MGVASLTLAAGARNRTASASDRAPVELEGSILRHGGKEGVLLQGEVETGDAAFRPPVSSRVFF
jgi:hypothetical protein